MSRSNHSEAQMIGALKQLEAGRKAEGVAREVGVSKHTIYAWKATYDGMGCPHGFGWGIGLDMAVSPASSRSELLRPLRVRVDRTKSFRSRWSGARVTVFVPLTK